ncbi:MAG: FAD-dependent oxidoreductase [Tissierellia bacterium]|nr:FAD-dependent oxidoreductase [Tissierellia bacterium]
MKIVIVGAVAAGATCATALRRKSEEYEIVMFEKDRDMSFSNCQIPYYLSDTFDDSKDLVGNDEESFKRKYNIDSKSCHEVVSIDRENKRVKVKDISGDKYFYESYDKLVLAPGASSIVPDIKGVDNDFVFTLRNVEDIEKIKKYATENKIKTATVVGGGFIGIETAENLKDVECKINIIDNGDELLSNIDSELKGIIHENIKAHGHNVLTGKKVTEIGDKVVIIDDKEKIQTDLVILAIGMKPNIKLAEDCGLEISENKTIKVDKNFLTSDKDIYAAGDAIDVYNLVSRKKTKLALAWPAHRQAKAIASHIHGEDIKNEAVIGSFILRSFDINVASTGLNEKTLEELGLDYKTSITTSIDKGGLMPDRKKMSIKLLFDKYTGVLYGAQAVGEGEVDKRIDVCATIIKLKGTIYDLDAAELCYNPLFSTPEDAINTAANQAINILDNKLRQVRLKDIMKEHDKYLIFDLRDEKSFNKSHIKNAHHLDYKELRESIDDISKDKKVLFYDYTGALSSNAIKTLNNFGYSNTYMLEGSYELLDKYMKLKNFNIYSC